MGSLTATTRAMASAMLTFLEMLKAGRDSLMATTRAADITVNQFIHNLIEMGAVISAKQLLGDTCVRDTMTANECVPCVCATESAVRNVNEGVLNHGNGPANTEEGGTEACEGVEDGTTHHSPFQSYQLFPICVYPAYRGEFI